MKLAREPKLPKCPQTKHTGVNSRKYDEAASHFNIIYSTHAIEVKTNVNTELLIAHPLGEETIATARQQVIYHCLTLDA